MYFISHFASTEGNRGGEFFTPLSIVRLLVEMLEPGNGKIFDPACGSCGIFIQSEAFIHNGHGLSFYGQEQIETTLRLGRMNSLLANAHPHFVASPLRNEDGPVPVGPGWNGWGRDRITGIMIW